MFVTITIRRLGHIKDLFHIYRPIWVINEPDNKSLVKEFKFLYAMHKLQKVLIERLKSGEDLDIQYAFDKLDNIFKLKSLINQNTYFRFCGGNEFRCEKQNLVSDFGLRDNYITFENNKFNLEVFNKPEMILNTIGDMHYIQSNIDILERLRNVQLSENDYVYMFIENPEKSLRTVEQQNEFIDLLISKFYAPKNIDEFIFVLTKSEHIVNKMNNIELQHPKHCLVTEFN